MLLRFALAVFLLLLAVLPPAAQAGRGLCCAERHPVVERIEGFRVDIKEGLSLTVDPSELSELTEWVSISWSGNADGKAYDWIAAYSPPPATLDDFARQLPVKYRNLTATPRERGSVGMELLHMRAPWVFAYMRGSYEEPTLLAVSNEVRYEPQLLNTPMQLRLARTHDPTEMRVVWTTHNSSNPWARWSLSEEFDDDVQQVRANSETYTRNSMCGDLASGIGWREPGMMHSVVFTELKPSTEYFYQVGDPSLGLWSATRSFFSAPARGEKNVDFFVFGDLGQAQTDGSIGWQEWVNVRGQLEADADQPRALDTLRSLQLDLDEGAVDERSALVLIIGDVAYARGRQALWEQFHHVLEPVASRAPTMTLLGNHEWGGPTSFIPGTDSGGECGLAHEVRFPMPSGSPGVEQQSRAGGMLGLSRRQSNRAELPWYSFDHGPVHLVMISSEHPTNSSSEQYAWLRRDLEAVDRSITPWVFVNSHRPMYVSSSDKVKEHSDMLVARRLRRELEPLLREFAVDVFAAGHHHSAQRSCPVYNETCVDGWMADEEAQANAELHVFEPLAPSNSNRRGEDSFGTVHLVTGAAGQWANVPLDTERHDWLQFGTSKVHGYTRVRVRGREMTLDFVGSDERAVWDSATIVQGDRLAGRPPRVRRNRSLTYPHNAALNEAMPSKPRRQRAIELA